MSAVAKIARPALMKGLHVQQVKKNIVVSTVVASVATAAFYFSVYKWRKDAYAEFYKNYDAEKDFQRMKAAGIFQSCGAGEDAE